MHIRRWILCIVLLAALSSVSPRAVAAGGPPISATYTYDEAGRLTKVSYSDGATISYTYDDAGNLLSREITRGFEIYLPLVLRNTAD